MKYTAALLSIVFSAGAMAEQMTHPVEQESVISDEAMAQMKAELAEQVEIEMGDMLREHRECASLQAEVTGLSMEYESAEKAGSDYTVLKPIETVLMDTVRLYRENCPTY